MKFCQPHWDALRGAIEARGLSHLVAKGGRRAAANMAAELRDGPSIQTFDPLMYAHNDIWQHAMEAPGVGLDLIAPNADGTERCPICYPRDLHAASCPGLPECPLTNATFEEWTGIAADHAKQTYDGLLAESKVDA